MQKGEESKDHLPLGEMQEEEDRTQASRAVQPQVSSQQSSEQQHAIITAHNTHLHIKAWKS